MARKFVDVIGGRDYYLPSATTLNRMLAVMPNGSPFWGAVENLTHPGAELPSGFDFSTHAWTLQFAFRNSSGVTSTVLGCGTPDGWGTITPRIWSVTYDAGTGKLTFSQITTANGTYRGVVSGAAAANTNNLIHITCAVGGTPIVYRNGASDVTASTAASGTPRPAVSGQHKMLLCGGGSAQGVTVPALFPRVLTPGEITQLYSALNAA